MITKAYVSGFYIHITSSGLYIHTSESSQAEWRFTKKRKRKKKDNRKWQEAVQYIFTTFPKKKKKRNVSRLIKQGKMEVIKKIKKSRPGEWKWYFFIGGCSDAWTVANVKSFCRLWMGALLPLCTFSSCAYHLFTWVGLITHMHTLTNIHTHTCECYKWCGGAAKQLWPQFHCQAAGLVNVKQQDGSPYEAH